MIILWKFLWRAVGCLIWSMFGLYVAQRTGNPAIMIPFTMVVFLTGWKLGLDDGCELIKDIWKLGK